MTDNILQISGSVERPPKVNDASEPFRRELHDGAMHTIVPAVLAVDGVMNGARVSAEELGKFVGAWNGRPVPVLHPEMMGAKVSAAADPKILERTVGTVFNAHMDDGKLKADLWLNEDKMAAIGALPVLADIQAGKMIEVSTSYFSDEIQDRGVFNGREYVVRHANLRPDHLALLPKDIGACSVADGCGVPRMNADRNLKKDVKNAFSVIMSALGLSQNCNCEGKSMDRKTMTTNILALLKATDPKLKNNEALTAKHLKVLEEMDDDQVEMMSLILSAKAQKGAANADGDEVDEGTGDDDEAAKAAALAAQAAADDNKAAAAKTNSAKTLTEADVDKLIANRMEAYGRRKDATDRLMANERNPFSAKELAEMSVDHLEKLVAGFATNDYAGVSGSHVFSNSAKVVPLGAPKGLLTPRKKDAG